MAGTEDAEMGAVPVKIFTVSVGVGPVPVPVTVTISVAGWPCGTYSDGPLRKVLVTK